jgi:hypothetical protein
MNSTASNSNRDIAVLAGVIFLITEVTAIGGLLAYGPVLNGAEYVVGAGADTRVFFGALLELMLAAANIGTAVVLFPIVKRQNEGLALAYVCGRVMEAAVIVVGAISLLAVVSLRHELVGAAGADPATYKVLGTTLVAVHNWTFLVGPNFILGCNSFMLAYLMFRSGLVPRAITILGMASGPLIVLSATAVMFGLYEQLSPIGGVAGLPSLAWEVSVALWMIIKGFRPSAPIISRSPLVPVAA